MCLALTMLFTFSAIAVSTPEAVAAASNKNKKADKKKNKKVPKVKKKQKSKKRKAKQKVKNKSKVFSNGLYEIPEVDFDFEKEVASLSKLKTADRTYYDGDFLLQYNSKGKYYTLTDFYGKLTMYKEERQLRKVYISNALFKKIVKLDGEDKTSKAYNFLPKSQYYTEDHKPALGSSGIDEDDLMYKAIMVALYGASLKQNNLTSIQKAYEADSYLYVDNNTLLVKQFGVSNQGLGKKYKDLYLNSNNDLMLKEGETIEYTLMSAPKNKVFNSKDVNTKLSFALSTSDMYSTAVSYPTRNLECFIYDTFGKVYAKDSTNKVVASINSDGRVVVGEPGVTKITYTNDDGITAYLNLTVVPFGISMRKINSFSNETQTLAIKNESSVDVFDFAINYTGVPYSVSKNILALPAGEEIYITLGKNPDVRATSASAINIDVYSMTSGSNVYEIEKDPLKISDYTANKDQSYDAVSKIINGTENFNFSTDFWKDICHCYFRLFIVKEKKLGEDKIEADYFSPYYNNESYLYTTIVNTPTDKGIYNGPVYYNTGIKYDQSYKSYVVRRISSHGRFIDLLDQDADDANSFKLEFLR